MAKVILPSGEEIIVTPNNGVDFSIEELKKFIGGGYIEIVHLSNGKLMVCDEDYLNKTDELPFNPKATELLFPSHGSYPVYGSVLICERRQIK